MSSIPNYFDHLAILLIFIAGAILGFRILPQAQYKPSLPWYRQDVSYLLKIVFWPKTPLSSEVCIKIGRIVGAYFLIYVVTSFAFLLMDGSIWNYFDEPYLVLIPCVTFLLLIPSYTGDKINLANRYIFFLQGVLLLFIYYFQYKNLFPYIFSEPSRCQNPRESGWCDLNFPGLSPFQFWYGFRLVYENLPVKLQFINLGAFSALMFLIGLVLSYLIENAHFKICLSCIIPNH
jgi:hypothetical protein